MIKHLMKSILLAGLMVVSASAVASEGGEMAAAHTNVHDVSSLQRGAMLFMNYCSGCHSLKYLRYSRLAEDLGLTKEQVMSNLVFTDAKFMDHIVPAMAAEDAAQWFGKAPPDLSLTVRAKGADWVYNYLHSFYLDPTSRVGWNNTVLKNAAMPNVLAPLQGIQKAVYGEDGETVKELKLIKPGRMTPAQFDEAVRDLTTFLQYAAEPAVLKRTSMGYWVILYLALFTLIAYMLKREFWKDVH